MKKEDVYIGQRVTAPRLTGLKNYYIALPEHFLAARKNGFDGKTVQTLYGTCGEVWLVRDAFGRMAAFSHAELSPSTQDFLPQELPSANP